MWLVLGALGSADACINELTAAERRRIAVAQATTVEEAQRRAAVAVAAHLAQDTSLVRIEVARRARQEAELRLAAEASAARERQAWWATLGVGVGLVGALASAVVTAALAVRVERAGGRREVRYA